MIITCVILFPSAKLQVSCQPRSLRAPAKKNQTTNDAQKRLYQPADYSLRLTDSSFPPLTHIWIQLRPSPHSPWILVSILAIVIDILACTMVQFCRSTGWKRARSRLHTNVINNEIWRAKAYSRVVRLEIDQSYVEASTLPSNSPDFSVIMEAEDEQPAAPVDFMDEEEVVDSNVDNYSVSDVGVDKDDLTKEQATISFLNAVVLDGESTSEEDEEELEDYVYAEDEIDEPMELDVHKTAMLNLLEHCQNAGTPLDFFDKLLSKLCKHGKNNLLQLNVL
jgi:hypothetical protein